MAVHYPPVGFHFRVDFGGLSSSSRDISFQKVSGLQVSITTSEHEEGGENRFKHRLPETVAHDNLVLERGLLKSSELIGWFTDAFESFRFSPRDVLVTLLNADHLPLDAWCFFQAYPVKWSASPFDAGQNEIVVESIELCYQYFRRVNV